MNKSKNCSIPGSLPARRAGESKNIKQKKKKKGFYGWKLWAKESPLTQSQRLFIQRCIKMPRSTRSRRRRTEHGRCLHLVATETSGRTANGLEGEIDLNASECITCQKQGFRAHGQTVQLPILATYLWWWELYVRRLHAHKITLRLYIGSCS